MYEQEQPASLSEMEERVNDLSKKISYLDNNFNHKDFKVVCGSHELELENFLAKHVLSHIRSTFVHEINELNKEMHHLTAKKKD